MTNPELIYVRLDRSVFCFSVMIKEALILNKRAAFLTVRLGTDLGACIDSRLSIVVSCSCRLRAKSLKL